MRARSNTIYCESLEDYIEVAKSTTSYITSRRSCHPSKKPTAKVTERQYKEAIPDDDDITPCDSNKDDQNKQFLDDWLDFDYGSKATDENEQISSLSGNHTIDTDCSDNAEARSNGGSIFRRVMMIGLDGCGKHSLINTAFECGRQALENGTQILDLLTKTEQDEDEGREIRYKFWIQNLKSNESKFKDQFKDMVKIYYKNVSLFVFMYSTTDRQSFICLEDAIKSVLEEVPAEKFNAILVGTKADLEQQREVSFCEAAALQEQFNLNSLIETNCNDETFKGILSGLLTKAEEDLEDAETKRRVSILSMD